MNRKMKYGNWMILATLILGFVLVSCGEDEEIEQSLDITIPKEDNTSDIENGTSDNPFVGSWYKVTVTGVHDLFVFNKDKTFSKWNVSSKNITTKENGTYSFTTDSLYLNYTSGNKNKYKIKEITNTTLNFGSYSLMASSLESLEEGNKPSTKESAINVNYFYGDTGEITVQMIPHFGISKFYYALEKSVDKNNGSIGSGFTKKTYSLSDLELGTTYNFSVKAYDSEGNAYKTKTIEFTTKGYKGQVNYLFYKGDCYELAYAKMAREYDYSGTNTGTNRKKLTIYLADEGYIQFYYCVHEWEAISEEWAEGTYTISSGKYYEYGSVLWLDGKVKDTSSGKLKIKHNSNGYSTFDIDLKNVVGHFEGKLTN